MLLGFATSPEDYKRILLNLKQELVLIRSSLDLNAVYLPETITNCNFKLKYISCYRIKTCYISCYRII